MSSPPGITVVSPVFNEAAVIVALARRCLAGASVDGFAPPRVLLVDDASTDDSAARIDAASMHGVHLHRLPQNRGQFGATQAGLALADTPYVVVLDGDLQDPPEHIGALVTHLRDHPELDVVFAAKQRREDPAWFLLGRAIYRAAFLLPGVASMPAGVGSYCVMRRPWATRVASVTTRHANLAAVLIALGARAGTVPFERAARVDGHSRVGLVGLIREGWGSWVLTGVVTAGGATLALASLGVGAAVPSARPLAWLVAIGAAVTATAAAMRRRALLHPA